MSDSPSRTSQVPIVKESWDEESAGEAGRENSYSSQARTLGCDGAGYAHAIKLMCALSRWQNSTHAQGYAAPLTACGLPCTSLCPPPRSHPRRTVCLLIVGLLPRHFGRHVADAAALGCGGK